MPADRLLAHFSSHGEIQEGSIGFDKQTGKSRGFALFVYKTAEAAKAALVDPVKTVDGYQMVCKLADGKKGIGEANFPWHWRSCAHRPFCSRGTTDGCRRGC